MITLKSSPVVINGHRHTAKIIQPLGLVCYLYYNRNLKIRAQFDTHQSLYLLYLHASTTVAVRLVSVALLLSSVTRHSYAPRLTVLILGTCSVWFGNMATFRSSIPISRPFRSHEKVKVTSGSLGVKATVKVNSITMEHQISAQ